jgi:hypothetical protein
VSAVYGLAWNSFADSGHKKTRPSLERAGFGVLYYWLNSTFHPVMHLPAPHPWEEVHTHSGHAGDGVHKQSFLKSAAAKTNDVMTLF